MNEHIQQHVLSWHWKERTEAAQEAFGLLVLTKIFWINLINICVLICKKCDETCGTTTKWCSWCAL